MWVAITGATGFIGRAVVEHCLECGDAVRVVTRTPERLPGPFQGLVEATAWDELDLDGIDAVVNLAGENLFSRRWNPGQKSRLRDSRIQATERVVAAIGRATRRPRVLVSASAVGYYGAHDEGELREDAPPAGDFLGRLCIDWEGAAAAASRFDCRVVPLRIGVVLERGGGALERMIPAFRFFLGGPVGSGKQWVSWIHRRDLARLVRFAMHRPSLVGPLNATAPEPVRMSELCRRLGRALGRPSWLKAPAFALRLALGEVAEVVLTGQRVLPGKARSLGFDFDCPTLDKALEEILTEEVVP